MIITGQPLGPRTRSYAAPPPVPTTLPAVRIASSCT
jgi:hypothetical protein